MAVVGKAAAAAVKGKKAAAIAGTGGDMRKNRVFQIMRQVGPLRGVQGDSVFFLQPLHQLVLIAGYGGS